MTTGRVFIATSLDGYVARKDHSLDWLMKQPQGPDDTGYEAFVETIDGLVMGRGSYETVKGFGTWPYTKPVVVLSKTLSQSDVPAELQDKVRTVDLSPKAAMDMLHAEGWTKAYVDGGRLVQSFMREGLIEELVITTIPILIGQGISLFGELPQDIDLELVSSKVLNENMVQSHYRVER
ncbi:dihydrofolate reductase [Rhodobacteraceae bacterium RKSG542]|uniref:dihydrofolate reductase family protein n=1 Tax=Pseudovibrio flavus TaxID=2529854 RepID=UPI0012BC5DD6|nr:dihydrofolate reductase family protein [Pseudovibrio flavus]MTI16547.1 dihydrofolate reductase [Pseudovibrio flavus]